MNEKSLCLTLLLKAWRGGDQAAGEQVIGLVYNELKAVASAYLRRERNVALQTTELVNEAYLRLVADKEIVFSDRAHFFGVAARAMRQILVEHVRKRMTQKRNGNRITLDDGINMIDGKPLNLLKLDDALNELESFDNKKAKLVELRFFTGLNLEETAAVMSISVSTVKREWQLAKAWLYNRLTQ